MSLRGCGYEPPGPGGFGTGGGSVSAVVVTSANMRERAVFIGSISVWDTIGTLPPSGIGIVTLFRPVYCCVMGRKAPRKRLAYRVMIRPTGVPPSTRTSLGAPPLRWLNYWDLLCISGRAVLSRSFPRFAGPVWSRLVRAPSRHGGTAKRTLRGVAADYDGLTGSL